ncbi:MAG: redoxin domain-containing protein [Dehalococcoidia bacterium]|jgi:peroxiredoxin
MKRRKWYTLLVLGLVFIVLGSAVACTKSEKVQYAPDFTLQSVNEAIVNLNDFRGRPVMLTFWRINCSACEFQMPFTQELYNKWSSDSLAVLTINVGDRASDVKDYMASRGITYPVLLDQQSKVAQAYGIVGVPTTYFIDGKGVLKAYQIGAFQSEDAMESAIKSVFSSITLSPKTETSPEIGKVAPDFTLETIDSQSISLNDFRGKTVLLNFWVSSCDACVSELPYLQTASDNRTDQQAVILTVNCGESSQTVHSIVDRLKPSFPVLLDPEGTICTAYKRGAPTAFLIDSNGIIRAIKDDAFENPGEVESMLDSLQ